MSTYAIGDLQGCCDAFERLLDAIRFDPAVDRVWLVGDLVNRGPASLQTLRRVMRLGDAAVTVLGNHDLHLLAASLGIRKLSKSDTLAEILDAPDAADLLAWTRTRKLAYAESIAGTPHLMVHAGILPHWTAADVLMRAAEVETVLRADAWKDFLAELYGNQPDRWSDTLEGKSRLRMIVNALTRLRFCTPDGVMDFDAKEGLDAAPQGYLPWFDIATRKSADVTVVFGHWSTLGLVQRPNLLALDTGCVWGGALTAVRLEDRARYQVTCPQYRRPG